MNYYIFSYNGAIYGKSGECYKTNYDLTEACPKCGTGAFLKDKLIVSGIKKANKDLFITFNDDFIISENLFNYISEKLELEFCNKVLGVKGESLPFYNFSTKISLPKANILDGLIVENQCSFCKRNGYYNALISDNNIEINSQRIKPILLNYSNSVIPVSHHILSSWEHIGSSNIRNTSIVLTNENIDNLYKNDVRWTVEKQVRYARPLIIVSEQLKTLLERFVVKNIKFSKVIIEN